MGKTQSKRSIDITTEVKHANEDDVIEKLEKIEDVDNQPLENGHTTNGCNMLKIDKDLPQEKNCVYNTDNIVKVAPDLSDVQENVQVIEEFSSISDENCKKLKQDKGKKKWSFRSISFGKKDKQKPIGKADDSKNSIVVNGIENIENSGGSSDASLFDNPKTKIFLENHTSDDHLHSQSEENTVQEMEGSTGVNDNIKSEIKNNMNSTQETDQLLTSIAIVPKFDIEPKNNIDEVCDSETVHQNMKEQSNHIIDTQINITPEGNIKSDKTISYSIDENQSIDIKTNMKLIDVCSQSFKDSAHGTHPPPLPSSPPPPQVSTFEFGDDKSDSENLINGKLVSAESESVRDGSVEHLNKKEMEIHEDISVAFTNDNNTIGNLNETNVSKSNCSLDMIIDCKQDNIENNIVSNTLEGNEMSSENIQKYNHEDENDKSLYEGEYSSSHELQKIPMNEDITKNSQNTKDIPIEDNVSENTTQ